MLLLWNQNVLQVIEQTQVMTARTEVHATVLLMRNGKGKAGEIRKNVGARCRLLPPELWRESKGRRRLCFRFWMCMAETRQSWKGRFPATSPGKKRLGCFQPQTFSSCECTVRSNKNTHTSPYCLEWKESILQCKRSYFPKISWLVRPRGYKDNTYFIGEISEGMKTCEPL